LPARPGVTTAIPVSDVPSRWGPSRPRLTVGDGRECLSDISINTPSADPTAAVEFVSDRQVRNPTSGAPLRDGAREIASSQTRDGSPGPRDGEPTEHCMRNSASGGAPRRPPHSRGGRDARPAPRIGFAQGGVPRARRSGAGDPAKLDPKAYPSDSRSRRIFINGRRGWISAPPGRSVMSVRFSS